LWGILTMMLKGKWIVALLMALTLLSAQIIGQANGKAGPNQQPPFTSLSAGNPSLLQQTPALRTSAIVSPQSTSSPIAKPECDGLPCDYPEPHISVSNPPPVAESWPTRDRITWAANVVLAIVSYGAIILAVSTLKKIERNTRATETLAMAAADSAQAALLNAQAVIDAGRPWMLISVEPSRSVLNSFVIKATNRGRCPANVIDSMERIMIAPDESQLPQTPEFENQESNPPFVPIILLPGESTTLKSFGRDDVKGICESEEIARRIENWEDKVFIYGKVLYRELIESADKPVHETSWCCWYIHGRQKSGLVIAGAPEYNVHT